MARIPKKGVKSYGEGMEKFSDEHEERVADLQKSIQDFRARHEAATLWDDVKIYIREFWG